MIDGFSKYSKEERIKHIEKIVGTETYKLLNKTGLIDTETENLINKFSENVIASYPIPFCIAPNFLINGKEYSVPMVTEESSVVAAVSKSAAFWYNRGGFKAEIIGKLKTGQIHFIWSGSSEQLIDKFEGWKHFLLEAANVVDKKMIQRGGGIKSISLIDKTSQMQSYYQIHVEFDTCNAMGANYINSCLELIAGKFELLVKESAELTGEFEIIMSILSNYSPNNAVRVFVECPVEKLDDGKLGMSVTTFAERFVQAINIAHIDVNRAVTHNKGIFNGIDAVVIATGNDWRAIEANGHSFAASTGVYKSLSSVTIEKGVFCFEAIIPMQVGTVGGITALHPLAKLSAKLLGNPSAAELMAIIASTGLASNFAAIKSLVTSGIQKGHMKLHLSNILAEFNVSKLEYEMATLFFADKPVSHSSVEEYIHKLRGA